MPKTRSVPTTTMSITMPVSVWYAFRNVVPKGQRSNKVVELMVKWLDQEGVTIE